uniref:cDNA FLJ57175, moderately similar to Pituitary tumor-transforming gene 1 protein-interacting protein n=1 Tax=Homo sapiens TaxID=9606 RepID=B4DRD2_HUMAN|nr:unnamed protein product [Homo sapiens]
MAPPRRSTSGAAAVPGGDRLCWSRSCNAPLTDRATGRPWRPEWPAGRRRTGGCASVAPRCSCCSSRWPPRRSRKPDRSEEKAMREREERRIRQEERRAEMKTRHDEIRKKYGLFKEENPYARFENN